MKTRRWLDLAEYASLIGLGVGAIASHLSAQLLYTSAPLSFALLLNVINRRRLMQESDQSNAIALQAMDQKVAKHIELLSQQVVELPTPEDVSRVKKALLSRNEEIRDHLAQQIQEVQTQLRERFEPLEQQKIGNVRKDLDQLRDRYIDLQKSVLGINTEIQKLSTFERVEELDRFVGKLRVDTDQLRVNLQTLADQTKPSLTGLQEQINHLNRQFQKLPPPFDSTALKQEVDELIRMVSDLVPKRDWSNLQAEMKALHQRQESQAQNEENLRRKVQELNQQMQSRPVKSNLTSLQNQINHLNRQFQKLPPPFDPTSLKQELAELIQSVADRVPKREINALAAQIKALQKQQEFQAQVEETLRRELQDIHQQIQQFLAGEPSIPAAVEAVVASGDGVPPQRQFQSRIEETLQRELKALNQQLHDLPTRPQLQAEIDQLLRRELQEINENLRGYPSDPHYELVFNFRSEAYDPNAEGAIASSRAVLEEALNTTQQRLIVIWPWSSQCILDRGLMQQFEHYLQQGRQLHLGWCHQAEQEPRFLTSINQRWAIQSRHPELQATLQKLLRLKQSYPDQFQFQILGTTENFMVSDTTFAVLGTDDSLTDNTLFSDLELKLRTTDTEVIQQLIHRFDNPVLHPHDVVAHWNRAVTRFDLGDREGALADFNQVLAVNPHDVVAYNYRGLVKFDLGDREGAVMDFSHALDINAQLVTVYCNRGFALSELGDQLGAMADYSLAIQYQPDLAIAYFYRGVAGQKFGDLQAALSDYSEAIQLAPDSAPAHYYRGAIHQKLDQIEEAIADFEIAATLFNQRGNTANAQKAVKSVAKLQHIQAARLTQAAAQATLTEQATATVTPQPPSDSALSHSDPPPEPAVHSPPEPEAPTVDQSPVVSAEPTHQPVILPPADAPESEPPVANGAAPVAAIPESVTPVEESAPDAKKPVVFETIDSFFREIDESDTPEMVEELPYSNGRKSNPAVAPESAPEIATNGVGSGYVRSLPTPSASPAGSNGSADHDPVLETVTLSNFFEYEQSESRLNRRHAAIEDSSASQSSDTSLADVPHESLAAPASAGLPPQSTTNVANLPLDSETLSDFSQRF